MKHHRISFKHALAGLSYMIRTQPNFRIHLVAAVLVLVTAATIKVNRYDWLILFFTIMVVMVAEMINTAIESVTDLLTDKYHVVAKISKDVAAGMVLVCAIFSVIIGVLIIWPYF